MIKVCKQTDCDRHSQPKHTQMTYKIKRKISKNLQREEADAS